MMGHGSHHTLVTTVMDHPSLSVLRGEVFKEHDPRLQNANVYTKTQKHRTQSQWYNCIFYVQCIKQQLWSNFYEPPCGFAALSQFSLFFLSPLSSPSHLAMALLLTQQLALVNQTGSNIWELTEQNHSMESYTLFPTAQRTAISLNMCGSLRFHFSTPFILYCYILHTAHYRFSDLITASQPSDRLLLLMDIKYCNSRQCNT